MNCFDFNCASFVAGYIVFGTIAVAIPFVIEKIQTHKLRKWVTKVSGRRARW